MKRTSLMENMNLNKILTVLSNHKTIDCLWIKTINKTFIYLIVSFIVLIAGCATAQMTTQLNNCLDSCLGQMTTTDVLMFASTPYETQSISDGEIWIYRYGATNSAYTTTGSGGVLNPYHTEEQSFESYFDIILRFNKENVLVQWSTGGNASPVWESDAPISLQRIPFTFHYCNPEK